MCSDLNLPLLGKVPLDPRIARSCDEGKSFLGEVPDSPAAKVYQNIVQSEFFFLFSLLLEVQAQAFSEASLVRMSDKCQEYVDVQGSLVFLMTSCWFGYMSKLNILKGEVIALQMGSSHLKRNKATSR